MTRIRNPKLIVAVLLAVGAGAAIVAITLARGGTDVSAGGPLSREHGSTATGAPVDLREPYSWGAVVLENSGERSATIDEIVLLEKPAQVRLLGMYALPIDNPEGIGFVHGFSDPGAPARSLTIAGGDALQLVVGLEVREPGRYVMPGVELHYRVGDRAYKTVLRDLIGLCAPKKTYDSCPVQPPDV